MQLKTRSHHSNENLTSELQRKEYRRHSNMINKQSFELVSSLSTDLTIVRNLELAASLSAFADLSIAWSEDSSNNETSSEEKVDNIVVPMAHHLVNNKNNNSGCIECNVPSNHLCQKCKKSVCSLGCLRWKEGAQKCLVARQVFQNTKTTKKIGS